MPSVINTNIASLNAQRNLNKSQSSMGTSLQRLSSGLRINSAKDDAAGLAISERFTSQIRGLNQAVRNANDGISLSQTAEGALGEVANNLQRVRELAVQSANATNNTEDRAALQAEASQLLAEVERVSGTANFNGVNLLDGSFANQTFQIGANANQTISIGSIADSSLTGLGLSSDAATVSAANGDIAAGPMQALAAGELTVNGTDITSASADAKAVAASISALTDVTATASNSVTYQLADLADSTTEGNQSTVSFDIAYDGGSNQSISVQGADGSDYTAAGSGGIADDLATAINAAFGGGEVVATANTTTGELTIETVDGGNFAISSFSSVDGAGTPNAVAQGGLADGTVVGQLDEITTTNSASIEIGGTAAANAGLTAGTTSAQLDILDVEGANAMITAVDSALGLVNSSRADLGALQNRFDSVIGSLQSTSENLSAARSRIMDTDFAMETANMTKNQILQQAGTAMLSQANSLPQSVLSLLG